MQGGQICGPVRIYRVDRFVIQFVYTGWKDLWSNSYIQSGEMCGPIRIYRLDRFVVQFVYTGWTDLWSNSYIQVGQFCGPVLVVTVYDLKTRKRKMTFRF